MSRRVKLVAFCLILAIFAVSNPTKAEYVAWARAHSRMVPAEDDVPDDPLGRIMTSALGVPIAEAETHARNWLLFSVYDCQTETGAVKVVGLLRYFTLVSITSVNDVVVPMAPAGDLP